MSYIGRRKQTGPERELLSELIQRDIGLPKGTPEHKKALKRMCSQVLDFHTFMDVREDTVQERVNGICSKLEFHNQGYKAQRIRALVDRLCQGSTTINSPSWAYVMALCCLARNTIGSEFRGEEMNGGGSDEEIRQEEKKRQKQKHIEEAAAVQEARREAEDDEALEAWKLEREEQQSSEDSETCSEDSFLTENEVEEESGAVERKNSIKRSEDDDQIYGYTDNDSRLPLIERSGASSLNIFDVLVGVTGMQTVPLILRNFERSSFGHYQVNLPTFSFHSSSVFSHKQNQFAGLPLRLDVYPESYVVDCTLSMLLGMLPSRLFRFQDTGNPELFCLANDVQDEQVAIPSFSPSILKCVLQRAVQAGNQMLRLSRLKRLLQFGFRKLRVFPYGQCFLEVCETIERIIREKRLELAKIHTANGKASEQAGIPARDAPPRDMINDRSMEIAELFQGSPPAISLIDVHDWVESASNTLDILESFLIGADAELWQATAREPNSCAIPAMTKKGCRRRTATMIDTLSDLSRAYCFRNTSLNVGVGTTPSCLGTRSTHDEKLRHLEEFYNQLKHHRTSVAADDGDDGTLVSAIMVTSLLLTALRPYLRVIDNWIYEGREIDSFCETVISLMTSQSSYNILYNPEESERLMSECPKVLKSSLHHIMTAGHTVRMLRQLSTGSDLVYKRNPAFSSSQFESTKEETKASVRDITFELRGKSALWHAVNSRINRFFSLDNSDQTQHIVDGLARDSDSNDPYLEDLMDFAEELPRRKYHLDHSIEATGSPSEEQQLANAIIRQGEPIDICFKHSLVPLLAEHTRFANANLAILLLGDLDLLRYLRVLKAIAFMTESHITGELCANLFKAIADGKAADYHDSNNLTSWLHSAVIYHQYAYPLQSVTEPEQNMESRNFAHIPVSLRHEFQYHYQHCCQQFSAHDVDTEAIQVQLSSYDKSTDAILSSGIRLAYDLPKPLTLVLDEESLNAYNRVFALLLRVNYARWSLCNFQHHQFRQDARRLDKLQRMSSKSSRIFVKCQEALQSATRQCYMINQYRRVVQQFSTGFLDHIMMKINAGEWEQMVKHLVRSGDVAEMRTIHSKYLQGILHSCLLTSRYDVPRKDLEALLARASSFCTRLRYWREQVALVDHYAMSSEHFERYRHYLDDALLKMNREFHTVISHGKRFQNALRMNLLSLKAALSSGWGQSLADLEILLDYNGYVSNSTVDIYSAAR
eukprot:gb/GECG01005976.1/.p1 GENE.gb/GECG01005976.1/~~gb/GECG01005976.1/.p1  ORF type:complete len:1221 (+),score=146.42 gb/GECG01005976.1/:1-3663(+)